jgi:hypothetical protein
MPQRMTRVNPSEETITIGPIRIRLLLTGDDSGGKVSVFEVTVPAGQRLAAPAHQNDAYEEVLYGLEGVLTWSGVRVRAGCCPGRGRDSAGWYHAAARSVYATKIYSTKVL